MKNLLADDHAELGAMLAELFEAFDRNRAEQIYEKLDRFWAYLAMHIRAEHLHLFPAIVNAVKQNAKSFEGGDESSAAENAESTIEQLRDDHNFFMNELALAIKQMREICGGKSKDETKSLLLVREKVVAVSRRLVEHNELEESKVYLWADSLLDAAETNALNAKIQKELNNAPARFKEL